MFKRLVAAALVFGTTALAPPATQAQNNCAPREILTERLTNRYSERLTGGGLQNSNTVLEVWASDKTGSFTVLVTQANGISFLVASGSNWNSIAPVDVPQGSKS